MKLTALALAGALVWLPAPVMPQSNPGAFLIPGPLSVVLMVGRWLAEPDQPRVYYIRVQARGATESEARREGYKRAIEEAIGSLVASESVVVNRDLQRREIIEYSAGYIDRFKVLNQYHDGRHFVVDMDVWVKHSQIADRLLVKSEHTGKIDGLRIQEQVQSLNYERDQGTRILGVIMADYPERAYDIKNQKLEVRYANRQAEITVSFDLDLNAGYLYALWETLKNTSQSATAGNCGRGCREPYVVHMIGRHNRVLFNRWEYSFGLTEPDRLDSMYQAMIASQPAVKLTMRDGGGTPIHTSCYQWPQIDGQVRYQYPPWQFVQFFDGNTRVSIDGRNTLQARIELKGARNIASAETIELAMVRGSKCPH
jgi:hypothetical protein